MKKIFAAFVLAILTLQLAYVQTQYLNVVPQNAFYEEVEQGHEINTCKSIQEPLAVLVFHTLK